MPEDRGTNVHRALSQYNSFFRDLVESLANDLLDEMKIKMKEAGWHEKVINSIKMSEITLNQSTGKISGKITANYISTRTQPDGKTTFIQRYRGPRIRHATTYHSGTLGASPTLGRQADRTATLSLRCLQSWYGKRGGNRDKAAWSATCHEGQDDAKYTGSSKVGVHTISHTDAQWRATTADVVQQG